MLLQQRTCESTRMDGETKEVREKLDRFSSVRNIVARLVTVTYRSRYFVNYLAIFGFFIYIYDRRKAARRISAEFLKDTIKLA